MGTCELFLNKERLKKHVTVNDCPGVDATDRQVVEEQKGTESQHMLEEQLTTSAHESQSENQVNTAKNVKVTKVDVMPTWAATKSLLMSNSPNTHGRTNTQVIAPLYKRSTTDYGTLYTVLTLTQGISSVVVGPHGKTIITLDMDLYSRALQIQQSVGNENWVLRAGVLHIAFAALHSLGKTIEGSGIDTCSIESGIYTSAALRGIYGGKAYKRGIEYHVTVCLAVMMLKFDAMFSVISAGPLPVQCSDLKKALHERNPEMTELASNIQLLHSEACRKYEESVRETVEMAQFLTEYLLQVESLLNLISACRSGDWEGYLAALENIIKYFFAQDLLNYSRLLPVHLAQMNALETDDPTTWEAEALKSGDFVVAKSEVPFTCMLTDQTLKQEIKTLMLIGVGNSSASRRRRGLLRT